jgi:hypothetical protein
MKVKPKRLFHCQNWILVLIMKAQIRWPTVAQKVASKEIKKRFAMLINIAYRFGN